MSAASTIRKLDQDNREQAVKVQKLYWTMRPDQLEIAMHLLRSWHAMSSITDFNHPTTRRAIKRALEQRP
jgi:hypothetical protein